VLVRLVVVVVGYGCTRGTADPNPLIGKQEMDIEDAELIVKKGGPLEAVRDNVVGSRRFDVHVSVDCRSGIVPKVREGMLETF